MGDDWGDFPRGHVDERELYLDWLGFLRNAAVRKLEGLSEEDARFRPEGKLISLIGIVNHLTGVEQRWIDGAMSGAEVGRSEAEFHPDASATVPEVVRRYREQGDTTDAFVRSTPLSTPSRAGHGTDLRWVLVHLINETARHAGHADATRELLDGLTGE